MGARLQRWSRYRPRHVVESGRLIFTTLNTMRDGLRFADALPAQPGTTAIAGDDGANPLEEYFDAVTEGPGILKWRHYFPIYHRHLAKFVGREVHVLEIGVFSGGSLSMWRSYFGDACQVYGVDIEPSCAIHEREGVRVFIGDQADPSFWDRVLPNLPRIDVVIDDGGHESHQQITTLRCVLPHIAMGGVYICEDIALPFLQFHSFVDGLTRRVSAFGDDAAQIVRENGELISAPAAPVHQQVASVHRYPSLTVIEKPEQQAETFESVKRGTVWQPHISG
jgi:hypothetical protein